MNLRTQTLNNSTYSLKKKIAGLLDTYQIYKQDNNVINIMDDKNYFSITRSAGW